jgi:hypothetical protein
LIAMPGLEGELTIVLSGGPLEKEYRAVCNALARAGTNANATFDAKPYDPAAIESVRDMWLERMAFEHRSTTVFCYLSAQLMEANATLDAKLVMLRMAQDELRHTETCGRVVETLGGKASRMSRIDVAPLAVHPGCSPEERAMRNVIYTTCLSEMTAVANFVDTLDRMGDPFMRARTRDLLADEVLHGQFGFHYLASWKPWLDANETVRGSIHRYLRHAFAVIERVLGGKPPPGTPRPTADQEALGFVDPFRASEVFYGTMEGAVIPALDTYGFDASRAWRERRLEPGAPPEPDVRV